MIYCAKHKGREAAYHCSRCEQGYCEECVEEKELHQVRMTLCVACGAPMTKLRAYRLVRPFWYRLPSILFFPFSGHGWFLLGAWTVLATVMLGLPPAAVAADKEFKYLDAYNTVGFLAYFVIMLAIVYRIISSSTDGEMKFPQLDVRGNLPQKLELMLPRLFGPFLSLFWPSILLFMCFWSTYHQAPYLGRETVLVAFASLLFVAFALGVFFLPMALLIASVFGNFTGIFNLVNIFRQTNKVRSDYAALWLALIVLGVGFGFARHGLRTTLLTGSPPLVLLCYALDGFLQIWLALVVAHLLGYLYFQNRFKLAWFPEFEDAPEFLVAGKAADMRPDDAKFRARMAGPAGGAAIAAAAGARAAAGPPGPRPLAPEAVAEAGAVPPGAAEKVAQGNFFIEHGSYDQALESFREALAEDPDNMGALRGLAQAGFRLDDHATVGVAGKRLGAELARQRAFEALWDMYQDYKNEIPAFTFEPDDLQALSRWLEGEGQELAAARLLRELAVTYPDRADAPAALLRCGELLDAKCGMADTAGKVWQALVERYPESEAAGKAREFLARNK